MLTSEILPPTRSIIGFPITALPFDKQISLILQWAKARASKVVCVANVHMLIEAYRNADFAHVLRMADIATPDGMPLVWMLKLLGAAQQDRVAGIDILLALAQQAPAENVSLFFLGSQDTILEKMRQRLESDFPDLKISGMEPLPFRPLTAAEDAAIVRTINDSGAGIVFVALGCPKQEAWMTQHRNQIQAVMIGLGGAFPVYAGVHRRAPKLIRMAGFEWLYRLAQEPRRLWKRYSSTIPIFIWLAIKQLLTGQKGRVAG